MPPLLEQEAIVIKVRKLLAPSAINWKTKSALVHSVSDSEPEGRRFKSFPPHQRNQLLTVIDIY
ncbi:uncharacterized protein METZ01_LOCUS148190 [marine metagenome]|uniref:Uncharacterized protein n=1 Tax=marine metagenome TaxID=408172 RepID=A0A382A1D4_9ZZZZ